MIPIAVLASGRGSNFQAILRTIQKGKLQAEVAVLVTDQPSAGALKIAQEAGIPTVVVPAVEASPTISGLEARRREHDARVIEAMKPYAPRFLVMAGYMRIVTPVLLEPFRSERGYTRIVNVHPSLLPAFPGVSSYAQAFEHGVQVTGVSVHLVEEQVDSGPILAQEAFSIRDLSSAQQVETRGLAVEHRLYPETLNWVLPENFEIEYRGKARRPCVRPN